MKRNLIFYLSNESLNLILDVEVLSLTMNTSDATKHYCTKNAPHASLARRNYNHPTYFKKRTNSIAMSATSNILSSILFLFHILVLYGNWKMFVKWLCYYFTGGNLHQLVIVELVAQAGLMLALQTHLDILLRHTKIVKDENLYATYSCHGIKH